MNRTFAATLCLVTLAGCASTGDRYPSLAIREAEIREADRVAGEFAVVPPAEPTPLPPIAPETAGRLGQLRAQAATAHQKFLAAVPGTRSAVAAARGSGITDDRWASAQVALADLDSSRSEAAIALGDLDLLFADAALAQELRDEIVVARTEVTGLIAEEDRVLAELRGAID
jgi:hypothetical protein